MTSSPVVAIAGASGHLGLRIATAVHAEQRKGKIKELVLLTRSGSKQPLEISNWRETRSVTLRSYDQESDIEELRGVFDGVDIVINAIGSAGYEFRDKVIQALAGSQVKLYLPSEFGVDHTIHDFQHPEWDHKKHHMELAQALLPRTKICRVFAGLFLEDSIGPWLGFDSKHSTYKCYGSKQTPISFTALGDVGNAVAQLVQMPLDQVPAQLHLAGDTKSVAQISEIMSEQSGGQIEVVEEDLQTGKEHELNHQRPDPAGCLRFLMGEGKIDHSAGAMGNDNDFVNPRGEKWKWRTLQDEATATGGKPWKDIDWKY